MTGFRQKFLKIAFESPRNKFHLEFFNDSHRVSSLVRQFDQINHRLRFFCTVDRSSPLNCTVYLSLYLRYCCNSREHLWKAFLCTFRICTALSSRKWEDGRYSVFLGRRHNRCPAHSPQTRSCNKNGGVLELFSRFRRGTENRGFIRIKKFLSTFKYISWQARRGCREYLWKCKKYSEYTKCSKIQSI